MVIVAIKTGDICKETEIPICQQCNCVTTKSHGLAKVIADTLGIDPYAKRKNMKGRLNCVAEPSTPGTFEVFKRDKHTVICMYAQYYPGKSGAWGRAYTELPKLSDDTKSRFAWFRKCLLEIAFEYTHVAMPFNIGCGLAGGNWKEYEELLKETELKITLYKI